MFFKPSVFLKKRRPESQHNRCVCSVLIPWLNTWSRIRSNPCDRHRVTCSLLTCKMKPPKIESPRRAQFIMQQIASFGVPCGLRI